MPDYEHERIRLLDAMRNQGGWGTHRDQSALDYVLLPESFVLRTGLRDT